MGAILADTSNRVTAVCRGAGGVGKTTTAAALAAARGRAAALWSF